jgi:hypothetical protein
VEAWRTEIFKQPYLIEILVTLILGAILIWTVVKAWNYISKPRQAAELKRGGQESREIISFTVGLFIFAYLASIVASMTMFDAATKFKLRILAPAYVGLFILLVYAGIWLRKRNRALVIVLTLVVLGFSMYKQFITFDQWSRSGLGYASFQWYDSQAMAYLRNLPADIRIYTNEPGAVYLNVGRGAVILPYRFDAARGLALEGFEDGVAAMQNEINAGRAVLALFDHGENIAGDAEVLSDGLHLDFKAQGDSIYTKP